VQRTTSRLDDFTTHDLTTFTTSRLVIDLETGFTVQKWVSRSIKSRESRESREVVSHEVIEVVMWSFALCHTNQTRSEICNTLRFSFEVFRSWG